MFKLQAYWTMVSAVLSISLVLLAGLPARALAQESGNEIHVLPVKGNIYMLVGAGGNVTASIGPDGVMLVDTGSAEMSDLLLATIQQLSTAAAAPLVPATCVGLACAASRNAYGWSSPAINAIISSPAPAKPIRYIVNTHYDSEHSAGNERIAMAGTTYTGGNVTGTIEDAGEGATILAHENTLFSMVDASEPPEALPTETYYLDKYKLSHYFNGEGVQLFHLPNAHTNEDTIVWFRFSDVISAGDIYSTETYPVIDVERGGSIQGILDGLNFILDLAFPEFRSQGGTMVIPGHGRLSDTGDVAIYRNMVSVVRDRIQNMIDEGMTLDQVQATRPTRDFDSRYGSETGPWTTGMFLEAVYRSLSGE